MKKYTSTVAVMIIMYAIPLAAHPELLFSVKALVVMSAAFVLFVTQPAMSVKEAKDKRSTDKNSLFAILIAAMAGQVVSMIEWAYVNGEPHLVQNRVVAGIGLSMIVGGLAFRIWSIRTLGKFFTATVQIKEGHRIVNVGPYRIVRHPSYLGSFTAIVGSAVFLEAPVGVVVSSVAMIIAYKLRIDAEEIALLDALGEAYQEYQKNTRKLIPCVW